MNILIFGIFIFASRKGGHISCRKSARQASRNGTLVVIFNKSKVIQLHFCVLCNCYEMLLSRELIPLEAHYSTVITQCWVLFFVSGGILLTIHKSTPSVRWPETTRKTKEPINLVKQIQSDTGGRGSD